MQFRNPVSALEFYVGHRMGDKLPPISHQDRINRVYDRWMVTIADIEGILLTFPRNIQKSLIDFAWDGIATPFTPITLRLFRNKLVDAGYMRRSGKNNTVPSQRSGYSMA